MKRSPECSLQFDRWPQEDRRLWSEKMEAGSLFDDERPGASLAATSRRGLRYAYATFLGFIAFHRPERLAAPPVERVDRVLIAEYASYLREARSEVSVAADLDRVRAVLVAFGGGDLAWLRKIQRRIARDAKPKARPLVTADELYQLGFDLMDGAIAEADANGSILDRQSKMYRDGMMIAFLAAIPVRRRALANMRIGTQLVRIGDQWTLNIPEEDTKTGVALEYDIAPALSARMDCYLERFRPTVPGSDRHDGVWASKFGNPMAGNTILQSVTRRTVERFGHAVSPHRFRHAAASLWSVDDPANVRGAKDLLGHKSFAMTEKHYIQAQARMAGRVLADTLAGLRQPPETTRTPHSEGV